MDKSRIDIRKFVNLSVRLKNISNRSDGEGSVKKGIEAAPLGGRDRVVGGGGGGVVALAQKEQRGVYISRTKIAKKTSIKGDAKVFF